MTPTARRRLLAFAVAVAVAVPAVAATDAAKTAQYVSASRSSRAPIDRSRRTAAPRPMAPAALGVPAPNRCAPVARCASSSAASVPTPCAMLLPPCQGGIASRIERRAHSTPIPIGPSILCPEKATKSAFSRLTSTGMCGTDCAASTNTAAPPARGWSTTVELKVVS